MTLLHFVGLGEDNYIQIQVWKNQKMIYKGRRFEFPDLLDKEDVRNWRVETKMMIITLGN